MSNRNNQAYQSLASLRMGWDRWVWFAAFAAQVLLIGCGGSPKVTLTCEPGAEDCPCRKGDERQCDDDDLVCAGDVCRKATCKQGSANCSCYGNLTCDKKSDGSWLVSNLGVCEEPTCRQGEAGCGCYPNGSCNEGLKCSDSNGVLLCTISGSCLPGTLGCSCGANKTCGPTDAGAPLSCVNEVCVNSGNPSCTAGDLNCSCKSDNTCSSSSLTCDVATHKCVSNGTQCPLGSKGCPCQSNKTCNSSDLTCSTANVCVSACTQGSENCGCKADNTCTGNATNGQALVCQQGLCVAASCQVGQHNCPCTASSTCSAVTDSCINGQCVTTSCPEGSAGCRCLPGQTCGTSKKGTALTCVAGTCTDCVTQSCVTNGLLKPTNPPCYTPCLKGFVDGAGAYHVCDADSLMRHEAGEACLDDKVCTSGSCVKKGASVPTCQSDIECPDFQNCIEGSCYAVCDNDLDCPDGLACHRHACRKPCSSDNQSCKDHTACTITDGTNGYCMPVGSAPTGSIEGPVLGTFSVSVDSIAFNSGNIDATFTIKNEGPVAATFTVTKIQHAENGGATVVTTHPMPWLKIGEPGKEAQVDQFKLLVSPEGGGGVDAGTDASGTISLQGAATQTLSRWDGVIEIKSENARLGSRRINLSYVGSADGRWAGKMYYFANFGSKNLDAWIADRANFSNLQVVGNALVRRWGDFRLGQVTRPNFEAALQSAVTGSWSWSSTRSGCPTQACYPYVDFAHPLGNGLEQFSDSLQDYPIPSDVSELPVAFDLKTSSADPSLFVGRIPTTEALHYLGDPQVTLKFVASPSAASCPFTNGGECVVFADTLSSTINVGGRYLIPKYGQANACPSNWQMQSTPWLVPGFVAWTDTNRDNGLLYRSECRDKTQPGGLAGTAPALNVSLASANPIPDGYTRSRKLSLVDGAMVDQNSMILIVKETFDSMLGAASSQLPVTAYGVITLKRTPAQLDVNSFNGNVPPAAQAPPAAASRIVSCSSSLLQKIGLSGDPTNEVTSANVPAIIDAVLNGTPLSGKPTAMDISRVHYLCHDTGKFDGGNTVANNNANYDCPAGSDVTYFYFSDIASMPTAAQIAALPCQTGGTCQQTLDAWRSSGAWGIGLEPPVYRCTNPNEVFCDTNRGDLRVGKEFYATGQGSPVFSPLRTAINDAFRYKTQFRTRTGSNVGFAPEACVPNSDAVPYCYDASQIEAARDRVDCAVKIYLPFGTSTDSNVQAALASLSDYLKINFGYTQTINPPLYTYDGFETMYAELLVMLGDDAYTSSFTARFDLAGSSHATFQGSLFEPGGIDLSGAAGYEMYELYQATQYYGLVLERLYALAPYMFDSAGAFESFITAPTFTWYFPKLVRASAQRTRAWSEIAKRYQAFNRPELARNVVKRAYTSAYLESVVIGNLVTRFLPNAGTEKNDIEKARDISALTNSAALLDMRDVFKKITDTVTYFGFAPDYIPFPALDPSDVNAFTKLFNLAQQRTADASMREQNALNSSRTYETDLASFQAELVKLRINYNNQLGDICGTFTGEDGGVYPAVAQYADMSSRTRALGDPCGFVGNGKLYDSMGQLEVVQLDMKKVQQEYDMLFSEIKIETDRVSQQCGLIVNLADAGYKTAQTVKSLQVDIDAAHIAETNLKWLLNGLDKLVTAMGCTIGMATNCPGAWSAFGTFVSAESIYSLTDIGLQTLIDSKQLEISQVQAAHVKWETLQQCNVAQVDSEALIKSKLLQLKNIDLDALKAEYNLKLALSQVATYRDKAKSLANEANEMEEQTINVEAARNDPNVRIYKNDAIINADLAFESAIAAAYQATKVFEYYSSQSYEHLMDLFLVRMVNYGDYNLNNYLTQLQDAYLSFQQQYGNPDDRVEILSLRDDVFAIARLDPSGQPITQADRIAQFRGRLKDVSLLDEQGDLTSPFATAINPLSPVTRTHTVKRLEAEISGSDVGDTVGRIYVRQKGTGVVSAVNGDPLYYRLPAVTAVINPFFNGVRVFTSDIYDNDRMRDRPVANSRWDLVINQKDETANMDIDLNSVTDIRLYVYYTDFTAQ